MNNYVHIRNQRVSKAVIQKWINALYSGEYKQTRNVLQDEHGYCCLGVACKVLVPKYKVDSFGFLIGSYPAPDLGAPLWLWAISDDVLSKTDNSLVAANDGYKYSFKEIGMILQAVYIEEALESVN